MGQHLPVPCQHLRFCPKIGYPAASNDMNHDFETKTLDLLPGACSTFLTQISHRFYNPDITSILCLDKSMKPNPDDDQVSSHFCWLTSNHLQLCSLCKLFMAKSPLLLVVFALCRIPVPKSYSERLGAGS